MSDLLEKCSVCGALIDEEDLFCANCGTEAPHQSEAQGQRQAATWRHNFECRGCGAAMSWDASAKALRCPFCGSEQLDEQKDAKVLAPNRVVPFAFDENRAHTILREWLKQGFWRPGDLAARAAIHEMKPVYVPYWVFDATTHTYWTADSSNTPPGARGDWYPLAGDHHGRYSGVLIGASSALTPQETAAICPFDLAAGRAPEEVDLENAIVEQFRVQRKYARPLARQGLENLERQACAPYVPGRCRNLKVNVRLENLTSEPVLVPVWIMAYRYRESVYRFLINGQTGRPWGQAPLSWIKIAIAVLIVIAVFLLIALIAGIANR
jgi:predicted RNA-binding Zn-ribbon protein involved in translation (DUF1610 family)